MRYCKLPFGEPIFYEGQYKEDNVYDLYIQMISCSFKIKKNQKIIRFVAIKQFKNFLAKPEGKLRLGVVTHITSKKKHK